MIENQKNREVLRRELSHGDFFKSLLCRLCLLLAAILLTFFSYFGVIEQPPFRFNGRNFENSYCYIEVNEISKPFAQFKNNDSSLVDKAYIVRSIQNQYFIIVVSDKVYSEYGLNNLTTGSIKIKGISEKLSDEFLLISKEAFKIIKQTECSSKTYLSIENKSFDAVRLLGLFGIVLGFVLLFKKLYDFFKMKVLKNRFENTLSEFFGDFKKIKNKILVFENFIAFEKSGVILCLRKEQIYWIYSKKIYRRFSPKEIVSKRIISVVLKDGTAFNIYEVSGRKSLKKDFENITEKLYSFFPYALKGFTLENLKAAKNTIFINKKTHL
ncbi:MAG: hypothetical protein ACTTK5_02630 [Candidatus Fimenecus sp.]